MSDGLDKWGQRVSREWLLREQELSLVKPIDPATEWSDRPTITAVEYRGRDGLIRWLAVHVWEWEDSGESHTAFATRVVDALLAVAKGGGKRRDE